MELFEAIFSRRSIRSYKTDKIPASYIEKIIKSAMFAPSAMNLQPWDFVICDAAESLDNLKKIVPHSEKMLASNGIAVLICGDKSLEKNEDYLVQNCSAATQNFLLAAHGIGLGACWIGIHPIKEIMDGLKNYFNMPDYIVPVSMVTLGYPAETKEFEERFKPEKIHKNIW